MSQQRLKHLNTIRSAVIKLGSQLLTDKTTARLDPAFMGQIAAQVLAMRQRGIAVTLVSSGAVAAGMAQLGLTRRPTDLAHLQAVAAVGQRRLMDVWADVFEPLKLPVAQLLLTREDIDDRTRFLNVRNTIHAAQEMGAIPIINENDTISTSEIVKITFGDNDILAAMVAAAMRANLLVLLTVVDGVLDEQGHAVRLIESLDRAEALVRCEKSAMGKGGMSSKLEAARMITDAGEVMIVANGRDQDVLLRALAGEEVGTLFAPSARKRSGRGRWIGAARAAGSIIIDDGAVCALRDRNRSLLPAGIIRVEGDFSPGDIVAIASTNGQTIARGLSNYSRNDIERIRGRKTSQVREMLGEAAYDEVVHRSNLIIMSRSMKPDS